MPAPINVHAFVGLGCTGLGMVFLLLLPVPAVFTLALVAAGVVFSSIGLAKANKGAMGNKTPAIAAFAVSILAVLVILVLILVNVLVHI
ncbi:hypothetical protein L6E12_26865 [Actinokineospora sp. PR83]|uniref:hypothetical protein n=1 Tax=Actinokineospora sp. PR83 TaxID=2884908 RepID=UPI001F2704DD|nr:hypothetical protein [Actinokineospora sp. PR83]MCG8919402.1 hypothetical protein [Actinokineospora sp. PR83]